MGRMCRLHELAVKFAKKQPGMVDSLTEDAPILDRCGWKAASHGLWHNAEVLTDVQGAAFIEMDAPIPQMAVSSDLERIDLYMLAGSMEVPTQKAIKMGGHAKYFSEMQSTILKQAGMSTEIRLINENWLKAAKYVNRNRNVPEAGLVDAGGAKEGWFILAVRFDEQSNCGLFDPGQFEQGRLLRPAYTYGGNEHHLTGKGYEGMLGYEIVYRGNFGWMIIPQNAHRVCSAIVNIDEENPPTPMMIDDILSDVRAQSGKTFLFCSPKAKTHAINVHKINLVQMVNADKDAKTMLDSWNGIPIVTSYNIMAKIPHVEVK